MTDLLWIFSRLDGGDIIDITLVAVAVFALLYLVRTTQAVPLLRGIILLAAIIGLLSNVFQFVAFNWLLNKAIPALLVAIPVIFQPELRRALERMGRVGALFNPAGSEKEMIEALIETTVTACRSLAARRHGALIVLERETGLQEYADTGVRLDADCSVELLLTIFDPNTPLHDGGVIVRNGRVLAAACVLPLTTAFLADRRLGLRHRAGIGVTETTDAITVIISEERGSISIAHNGRIIRRLDADRLKGVLRAFYQARLSPRFSLNLSWLWRGRRDSSPEEAGAVRVSEATHSPGDHGDDGASEGAGVLDTELARSSHVGEVPGPPPEPLGGSGLLDEQGDPEGSAVGAQEQEL